MSEKIRWALLSTARINTALIEPIRQAERSELVAVASRDEAKARAYAQEHGIPKRLAVMRRFWPTRRWMSFISHCPILFIVSGR
jgi:predicted dehydrogenase